jgi:hypothetical protein
MTASRYASHDSFSVQSTYFIITVSWSGSCNVFDGKLIFTQMYLHNCRGIQKSRLGSGLYELLRFIV